MIKTVPAMRETWVPSLGWEELLQKGMATHSSILPWRFHGQRSLVSCSPWGRKESTMTEQLTHMHTPLISRHILILQLLKLENCARIGIMKLTTSSSGPWPTASSYHLSVAYWLSQLSQEVQS